MAASIETQSVSKSGVPYWALDHLFGEVVLIKDYDENNDGRFIYRSGYIGLLNDIRSQGNRIFAGVQCFIKCCFKCQDVF